MLDAGILMPAASALMLMPSYVKQQTYGIPSLGIEKIPELCFSTIFG
jgi:hypothetical protein